MSRPVHGPCTYQILAKLWNVFSKMDISERSRSCRSRETSNSVGQVGEDEASVRRGRGSKKSHGVGDGSFSHCVGSGIGYPSLGDDGVLKGYIPFLGCS